jgi:hypothetical protein
VQTLTHFWHPRAGEFESFAARSGARNLRIANALEVTEQSPDRASKLVPKKPQR